LGRFAIPSSFLTNSMEGKAHLLILVSKERRVGTMEVSSALTDVPLSYKELSYVRIDTGQHGIGVGETEMRTHRNYSEETSYSTLQQIPSLLSRGTKRRSRWQSRTCSSQHTDRQQHSNQGFLLLITGLISILLQVCSGFALVPVQRHHNVYTNRYSSRQTLSSPIAASSSSRDSRHSRLYAIETDPFSRVRRKSGEEDQSLLPTYYDDEENKLARRLFPEAARAVEASSSRAEHPEEIHGAPLAQDEVNNDAQDDDDDQDDDSEKEIIMDDEDDDDDDVDMAAQRRSTLKRAALLGRKSGAGYRSNARASAKGKSTSVGERKVGSATKARQGAGATSRVMDTVRKTALGTAAAAEKKRGSDKEKPTTTNSVKGITTKSQIHSTIEDILKMRRPSVHKPPTGEEDRFAAAVSLIGRGMGFFGDTKNDALIAKRNESQFSKAKLNPWTIDTNNISVRAAISSDDVDIACLRLSVFSDISPDVQNQFVTRSCQAIMNRRMRGAKCVVATVPLTASGSRSSNHLLGSAECSFHEFFSTKLGRRRPQHSILYVTEFAVNPAARRRGIGLRLLNSLHEQAGEAETLYLHVDVTNREAISLYEKAGYRRVESDDPMFMDFTASLNLHPGATKGRVHHLYYKDLVEKPTWLRDDYHNDEHSSATIQKDSVMGNLGFVVP
jgi:ribosomal protein S18 acetylase RimI-like enzyme